MAHAGGSRRPTSRPEAAPGGVGLVAALAAVASEFSPKARAAKRRLLAAIAAAPIAEPATLARLHEALCFLQAYPDDREILGRVDGLLRDFAVRTRSLGPGARARLHDSGIAGSTLEYPYGLPLSRWLATRLGRHADVGWAGIPDTEHIADALDLLVTPSESDAFSEGGFTVRRWLEVARAGRRLTDLQVLVEAFDRAPLDPGLRDWLFESLGLPVRIRLAVPGVSRTLAKRAVEHPVFQRVPLRRAGVNVVREATRPLSLRRASRELAGELIETARVAMVTRSRELHAFSYPNVQDVLVGEAGRGLRVVLIGLEPAFRLPFEGYYAFLAIRNGVPVSYGGGWCLFETLEFGFNVFESFRQGESAWILGQALRAYHQVFGMRTVVVDPYQLGAGNLEALRSGAFYFYLHLGFRPRTDTVRRVLEEELGKIARDRRYRSPLSALRRLAREEACLTLPGGSAEPERRLRARDLAALVTRDVARRHGGDREAATRKAMRRVARALGVGRLAGWTDAERQAFRQWALVLALVPDLDRWSPASRTRLVRMVRAKGGRGEGPYVRRLRGLAPLGRALEALARPAPPGSRRGSPLARLRRLRGGIATAGWPGRRRRSRPGRRRRGPRSRPRPGGATTRPAPRRG